LASTRVRFSISMPPQSVSWFKHSPSLLMLRVSRPMSYACGGLTPDLGLGQVQPHSHRVMSRHQPIPEFILSSTRWILPLVMLGTRGRRGVFGSHMHPQKTHPVDTGGGVLSTCMGVGTCKINYHIQRNQKVKMKSDIARGLACQPTLGVPFEASECVKNDIKHEKLQ